MISIIESCHAGGVIHRDIKADNILVNDSMEVKLVDFGLAIRLVGTKKLVLSKCGTLRYMAPEILLRKAGDP